MPDRALENPELRPFLPMLWIAWADGDLTDAELRELSRAVDETPWLSREGREDLARWLDPEEPPDAERLAELLRTIERVAGTLPVSRRCSLAELGSAMVEDGGARPAEVEKALGRMLEALGVDGPGVGGSLLPPAPNPEPSTPDPRFDVDALTALLDGERVAVRERARAFLSSTDHRPEPTVPMEQYRELVLVWLRELAEAGFGAMAYPGVTTDTGDMGDFMVAFETLAYGDLSLVVKYGVQFGLFGGSIYHLGNDAQRREHLPKVASLELPGCFAMTELGHGSNVMDLETTATFDADTDELVIHTPSESARKEWIGNAAKHGRMATVFAQLEVGEARHGVHAILVPIRDEHGEPLPGVRIGDCGHKLGLNGVDNGRLWFDHVRVPRTSLLDRYGTITEDGRYESPIASATKRFFTMLGTLVAGRVSVGSAGLSASKVGLAVAVRYAESRRQFGPEGGPEATLLDYRTHQRRLLPRLAASYALHFAVDDLRRRYLAAGEEDTRAIEAEAAGIKAYATRHATETLQACREACGGQGYAAANRIGPLKSDTDVFTTFEGDNTVLLQLVAKSLLTGLSRDLSDGRMVGVVRWLARRAGAAIAETNPVISRMTDPAHLRDPSFLRDVFRYRESSLLASAATRLRKRLKATGDGFAALLETQDHLIALAEAHVERVVLERFGAAITAVEDDAIRAALDRLRDLWALWRLEQDLGWFLEHGLMEPGKSRAVRKELNRLCAEIRPDALALVEAFGIPDACLAAPIAFGDPARR